MAKGLGQFIQHARKLQEQMARLQEEMAHRTVEASVGGGMVTVTVNGRQQVVDVKIEPDVVNPDDVEMLQDLILAAVNEGIRRSQEMVNQEMQKITGGLNIPGLNLPGILGPS
ncbi:MAG: YbaB/EbfC family nucleoid-associated protein [Deltaproteobacteria bacterium]|nr:YbaB/EbfC family nucleoid-associated protein [Deltaproteobacteria bacterium]MBW2308725.1 YbaB/EbfC family nucleoid-associated protein [Deltaproteobacteria bacterium]